jgi:hypothetical protein
MGAIKYLLIIILVFSIGLSLGLALNSKADIPLEIADSYNTMEKPYELILEKLSRLPESIDSPSDRIKEEDIYIFNRRIIINIENPIVARFTDTKSMEPVINKDSNAIEIVPESPDDINVGDIISYETPLSQGTVIHRVIEKGIDEKGTYFITKGDNLDYSDPQKIRFSQIKRVVVGILY